MYWLRTRKGLSTSSSICKQRGNLDVGRVRLQRERGRGGQQPEQGSLSTLLCHKNSLQYPPLSGHVADLVFDSGDQIAAHWPSCATDAIQFLTRNLSGESPEPTLFSTCNQLLPRLELQNPWLCLPGCSAAAKQGNPGGSFSI